MPRKLRKNPVRISRGGYARYSAGPKKPVQTRYLNHSAPPVLDSRSEVVETRLSRIEANYDTLAAMLDVVELKTQQLQFASVVVPPSDDAGRGDNLSAEVPRHPK